MVLERLLHGVDGGAARTVSCFISELMFLTPEPDRFYDTQPTLIGDVKQSIAPGCLGGLTQHDYENCQAQDALGGFVLDHAASMGALYRLALPYHRRVH